jgi:hypothetical protein
MLCRVIRHGVLLSASGKGRGGEGFTLGKGRADKLEAEYDVLHHQK